MKQRTSCISREWKNEKNERKLKTEKNVGPKRNTFHFADVMWQKSAIKHQISSITTVHLKAQNRKIGKKQKQIG